MLHPSAMTDSVSNVHRATVVRSAKDRSTDNDADNDEKLQTLATVTEHACLQSQLALKHQHRPLAATSARSI